MALDPDDAYAYYARGVVFLSQGDADRAVQDLDTALRLNASLAVGYASRGSIHLARGSLALAIQDFDKALTLDPENVGVHNDRGVAYWRKGDYGRALQDYSEALNLRPNKAAFTNRGNLLMQRGEWEKARNDLLRARNMGMDIVAAFRDISESVADFERQHNVKLPDDFVRMVGIEEEPRQHNAGEAVLRIFKEIHESSPDAEWEALPADGAKNKKHYLYGYPKQ